LDGLGLLGKGGGGRHGELPPASPSTRHLLKMARRIPTRLLDSEEIFMILFTLLARARTRERG
jgi:hypothetical protein